jgi:hypothetical protein
MAIAGTMMSLLDNAEAAERRGVFATADVGDTEVAAENVDDEANGEEDGVCEGSGADAAEVDEEGVDPAVPLELIEELPTVSIVNALADEDTRWGADADNELAIDESCAVEDGEEGLKGEDEEEEESGEEAVAELDSDEVEEEEDDCKNEGDDAIVAVEPAPVALTDAEPVEEDDWARVGTRLATCSVGTGCPWKLKLTLFCTMKPASLRNVVSMTGKEAGAVAGPTTHGG